jgi:hypothetical protein
VMTTIYDPIKRNQPDTKGWYWILRKNGFPPKPEIAEWDGTYFRTTVPNGHVLFPYEVVKWCGLIPDPHDW